MTTGRGAQSHGTVGRDIPDNPGVNNLSRIGLDSRSMLDTEGPNPKVGGGVVARGTRQTG